MLTFPMCLQTSEVKRRFTSTREFIEGILRYVIGYSDAIYTRKLNMTSYKSKMHLFAAVHEVKF